MHRIHLSRPVFTLAQLLAKRAWRFRLNHWSVGFAAGLCIWLGLTSVTAKNKPAFLSLPVAAAQAQGAGAWRAIGPTGGTVRAVVTGNANANLLYAAAGSGLFRSTNAGTNWTKMNAGLPGGNLNTYALALHPGNDATLYVGVGNDTTLTGGVYRTTDGGASWTGLNNPFGLKSVTALAIGQNNPNTLYAVVNRNQLYRTTDAGASWSLMNLPGLASTATLLSVAIHPGASTTAYAAATPGGLYRTTDGGANWTALLSTQSVTSLALAPNNGAVVYAGTRSGQVQKSTDGGNNWTALASGLNGTPLRSLTISKTDANVLLASTDADPQITSGNYIYRSTNGGQSWSAINASLSDQYRYPALAIAANNSAVLFAGSAGRGLAKSTDGGASWSKIDNGLTGFSINSLSFTYDNPSFLYVATEIDTVDGESVYKSTDGGQSWAGATDEIRGQPNRSVRSIAAHTGDPLLALVSVATGNSGSGIYRTLDAVNWSVTSGVGNEPVTNLEFSPGASFIALGYAGNVGTLRSLDAGVSWSRLPMPNGQASNGLHPFAFDPANSGVVFAVFPAATGQTAGLYRSTNNGSNWALVGAQPGNGINALAVSRSNPSCLYALTASAQIYKSTNGGASWTLANSGFTGNANGRLLVNPTNQNNVIVATTNAGAFLTNNGGANWLAVNGGLDTLAIHSAAQSSNGQIVRVATQNGVYEFDANGTCNVPTITAQPQPQTICAGRPVSFSAAANGTGTLAFRWRKNGTEIPGANANTYTINAVSANDAGNYEVVITDLCGATTSSAASLTVASLSIAPSNQSMNASGGSGTVTVTSNGNCSWTASSNAAWLTITAGTAGTGNGTVSFTAAANPGGARTGTLTIAGQSFTVNQAAQACSYSLSATSQNVGSSATSSTVNVTTTNGCSWTATSNANWLTVTGGATGSGNGVVSFSVAANTGAARSGTLSIAGLSFTVNQAAVACSYNLTASSFNTGATATTSSVGVTAPAGCGWTASSNVNWLSVTGGTSGNGNGTVNFAVAANTGAARVGTLTIAGKTFTVSQATIACSYSIAPAGFNTGPAATSSSVAVTATASCGWTANSNANWLAITSGASGNGNGTVQFAVAANTGPTRAGTLTIAGRSFTVTQAGAPVCTYAINPTSRSVEAASTTGTVSVTAPGGCTWTATSNATSWLTVTGGASGNGNGTVTYAVAANTGAQRMAAITIAGLNFTVTQAAGSTDPQAVVWTNFVNTQFSNNVLRNVNGVNDGRWDGSAISQQQYTAGDFYVEFQAPGPHKYRSVGLSPNGINGDPDSTEFAMYFTNVNIVEFRERGRYIGDARFSPHDVFRISVEGTLVYFHINGVAVAISNRKATYPLRVVAGFSIVGGEISNAKLINGRPPRAHSYRQNGTSTGLPCRECTSSQALPARLRSAAGRSDEQ